MTTTPILEVSDLHVRFKGRRRGLQPARSVHAVNGVSLTIGDRETLGLVGESGSGKSTTGRAITRLIEPTAGTIRLAGTDITSMSPKKLRPLRPKLQMVFQDPYSSVDPAMTIGDSIAEPLIVHTNLSRRQRRDRSVELLDRVGLAARYLERYPSEFSGGQLQRVAIARAIALNPDLIICDEAVSALDVSTENQILDLLQELQDEAGISYLFIAHDLAVVRELSSRVAVMYLGRLVEMGPTNEIFAAASHPYTRALLDAVPVPDPAIQRHRRRIVLQGEPPDPANPPPGCPFNTRCPSVMEICEKEFPAKVHLPTGVDVACHLYPPSEYPLTLSVKTTEPTKAQTPQVIMSNASTRP